MKNVLNTVPQAAERINDEFDALKLVYHFIYVHILFFISKYYWGTVHCMQPTVLPNGSVVLHRIYGPSSFKLF